MKPKPAHTPGPWVTQYDHAGRYCVIPAGTDVAARVATVQHYLRERESFANASLIAAAPEMLDALREIAESYLTPPAVKARALAAIASAEGGAS